MNNTINFSIIIPTKNIPDLLQRCLESIPQRSDIEIIVVDDNSDREIVDVKNYPGTNNQQVKIIFLPESKGAGYARNIGLTIAKGKWILFADSDDYVSEKFSDILDRYINSEYDIIFLNYERVDSVTKEKIHVYRQSFITGKNLNDKLLENKLRFVMGPPWCKMIAHHLIKKYNVKFDEVAKHNDTMFSLKIGYYADRIFIDPEIAYYNTQREGSITTSRFAPSSIYISTIFDVEMDYMKFAREHHIKFVKWRLWDSTIACARNEKDLIFEILKYLHKKHCLRMLLLKMPVYLTIRIYNKCFGND